MGSLIKHYDSIPEGATNFAYAPSEGQGRIWAYDGAGQAVCVTVGSGPGAVPADPVEAIKNRGWKPDLDRLDAGDLPDFYDWACRTHQKVWRYWITTPDSSIEGVRSFVAAAESGGLPSDWTEQPAENSSGTAHTVCSFTLTMDGARALGSEQQALMELASLPGDVHFFQRVAQIDGFIGVEKQSRQPDTLSTDLYEPGDLFQTSHPDAASARGQQWREQDVLTTTDLVLA